VSFQGYYLLRCDRVDKVGDSMVLYIANFLHAKILHQSEDKFCGRSEFLVLEISVAGSFKLLL